MGGQPAGQKKNGWMFGLQVSGEQVVIYLEAGNTWSTTGCILGHVLS